MLSHSLNVFDVVLVKGCSIQVHHGLYQLLFKAGYNSRAMIGIHA